MLCSRALGGLLLACAVLLSGCFGSEESAPSGTADVIGPDGSFEKEIAGSEQNPEIAPIEERSDEVIASTHWNFTYDFPGDTVALSFELESTTRLVFRGELENASFDTSGPDAALGALLLYEPSWGPTIVYSVTVSTHPFTDYHYSIETPLGTVEDEQRYEFEAHWKSGDNEITLDIPAGDWTLIFLTPGSYHMVYSQWLEFDKEVVVRGPVWGPLGFNHDARAFHGQAAVLGGQFGVQYDRWCLVKADHTAIMIVNALYYGPHLMSIQSPNGTLEEYVSPGSGSYYRIEDQYQLPIYRVYEPGEWKFTVSAGAGVGPGYNFNLMGVDIPLPSHGYQGYHSDDEADRGCD